MPPPNWVDFESAEWSAAVMARNLSGPSQTWGALLAHAQSVLAARTDSLYPELGDSYDFHEWRDLVAASRILDLAATEHGISDPGSRKDAAILATCAFGMSGTFVSAAAVIRNHRILESDLSPGELTALALSSPTLSREILPRIPIELKHKDCIENFTAFLATGDEVQFETVTKLLQELTYEETGIWEGYLLRISRLPLAHAGQLVTAKVLDPYRSRFPIGYLGRLIDDSPLLLPSQYEAINRHGAVSSSENLLITLPPGTGKTLLGEMALLSSLGQRPGLVCYISPYVALARQVSERIHRHIPDGVRVHQSMGDYRSPESLDPQTHLEVLIATPERFDAMLRFRPDLLSSIRCVVIDEAHLLGNSQRGLRLEGILTRLRLASVRGEIVPRFVLMSAVLSNADALAKWIGIKQANFIRGTWRPSAQRLLRWTEDGLLRLHAGDDPLRNVPHEVLGETLLPWPNRRFYPSQHFGSTRKQEPLALENVAFLAEYASQLHRQPVLCVCSTRKRTRHLAAQISRRFAPLEPLPEPIRKITDLIDQEHQFLRPLKEYLQRGVAYHNSSLPHKIREGIEKAVESRTLKAVAATTTLAEGVDLPFRVTILVDWLIFDGNKNRPMESLLFKNIAGRCGRAGHFTEGDTFVFDNPVGDAEYTSPARRPELQENIFFANTHPTLTSAIDRLDRKASIATIGSQLLAAIAENPEVEDLASSFHMHSFAYQTHSESSAEQPIDLAYKEILDGVDEQPLAIAASPVQLTRFGDAVNKSGLSPGTAKILRRAIGELPDHGSSLEDLVTIGVALLKSLSNVPEQRDRDLRKAVENPQSLPVVRLDELELVLRLWLEGRQIESIFAELPSNKRSSRKPNLQTWLQGVSKESTWNDQFAKFYDFMDNCVEFFLPWILRASQLLAEIDGKHEVPWREWAQFVQVGVGSTWGLFLLENEIVTERTTAFHVGTQLDKLVPDNEPNIQQAKQLLPKVMETQPPV